jgi:hypothetical protein
MSRPLDRVAAPAPVNEVVARAAIDGIIAGAGGDGVVAAVAEDVHASATADGDLVGEVVSDDCMHGREGIVVVVQASEGPQVDRGKELDRFRFERVDAAGVAEAGQASAGVYPNEIIAQTTDDGGRRVDDIELVGVVPAVEDDRNECLRLADMNEIRAVATVDTDAIEGAVLEVGVEAVDGDDHIAFVVAAFTENDFIIAAGTGDEQGAIAGNDGHAGAAR